MDSSAHVDGRFDDDDVTDELLQSGREIAMGFAALDPAVLPQTSVRPWMADH